MTDPVFKDAWGFSKLDTFRQCPRKFKYQFIDKLPVDYSSPALERGARIHDALEAYVNGWQPEPPPEAVDWIQQLNALKDSGKAVTEGALGFDKNWALRPNWFGPETWLRVKMDVRVPEGGTLRIIDYKTGKFRKPSTDQIELYACTGPALHPGVQTIVTEFWFIDAGETYDRTYDVAEIPALRRKYEGEVAHIYNERRWPTQPSLACRWCPFSKTRGGPCEY